LGVAGLRLETGEDSTEVIHLLALLEQQLAAAAVATTEMARVSMAVQVAVRARLVRVGLVQAAKGIKAACFLMTGKQDSLELVAAAGLVAKATHRFRILAAMAA
jgi:hypothetical protein